MTLSKPLTLVDLVKGSFVRFTTGKRPLPTGPCGQTVGCESWRLDFTGFQEAEVHDCIHLLEEALKSEPATKPQTSLDYFNQVETALIVLKLKTGKVLAFDLRQIPDAQQTWWLIEKLLKGSRLP